MIFLGMKSESVQKRGVRIGRVALLVILTLFLLLYNWVADAISQAHIRPGVEWVDVRGLLEQGQPGEAQLDVLSEQTGLHPKVVGRMLAEGREAELLQIQQKYFAPVRLKSLNTTPLTISEQLVDEEGHVSFGMPLVDLQAGDILITKNSRFLGWRNGHAALVINPQEGLLLEAVMPGTNTRLSTISKWSYYPSFQVLRLKEEYRRRQGESKEILPERIARYAEEHLIEVPYQLWAGVWNRSFQVVPAMVQAEAADGGREGTIKGTQCAHLVWYAYKQFGIDLDSDGGIVVTPNDIQNSEYLEIIQTYGY